MGAGVPARFHFFIPDFKTGVTRLAAERLQPLLVADELLARGAGSGATGLGFLDFAPVVIVGRHHAAAFEQPFEALGAGPIARASRRHFSGDPVGDLIAVGPIGADRARGAAPRPADRVEPVGYLAAIVEEFAAAFV